MKTYDERIESIFRKYEERLAEKKRRSAIIRRATVSSGAGAAVLLGVWFVSGDTLKKSINNDYPENIIETETTAVTTASVTNAADKKTASVTTKNISTKTTSAHTANSETHTQAVNTAPAGNDRSLDTSVASKSDISAGTQTAAVTNNTIRTAVISENTTASASEKTDSITTTVAPATQSLVTKPRTTVQEMTTENESFRTTTTPFIVTKPTSAQNPSGPESVTPEKLEPVPAEIIHELFSEFDLLNDKKVVWYMDDIPVDARGGTRLSLLIERTASDGEKYKAMATIHVYTGSTNGLPEDMDFVAVSFNNTEETYLYKYIPAPDKWNYSEIHLNEGLNTYKYQETEVEAKEADSIIENTDISFTDYYTMKTFTENVEVYSLKGISSDYAVAVLDKNGLYHLYVNQSFKPMSIKDVKEKMGVRDLKFDSTVYFKAKYSSDTDRETYSVDPDVISDMIFSSSTFRLNANGRPEGESIVIEAETQQTFRTKITFTIYKNGNMLISLNGGEVKCYLGSIRARDIISYVTQK